MITCFDKIHERGGRTDRQTDERTSHDGIGQCIAPRNKKKNNKIGLLTFMKISETVQYSDSYSERQ